MSFTSSPQYPVFDEEVTLSLTAALGTAFAFELTSTPNQSALATGLLLKEQAPSAPIPTSPVIAANDELIIDTFTPDVAGVYGFTGYDLKKVVGVPAFEGDPSADERFEILGTQTGTLNVGIIMELPVITTDTHGGTLELRIIQSTIRGAEIVDTTTDIARLAALEPSVIAALGEVVNKEIDSASTDFLLALRDVSDVYNGNPSSIPPLKGHRNMSINPLDGGRHLEPDNVNVLASGIPFSLKYAVKLVNELRDALIGHLEGSVKYAKLVPAAATQPQYDEFWHFTAEQPANAGSPINLGVTGRPGVDSTTTPVIGLATGLPTAAVLLCELRLRCYARHINLRHAGGGHPWLTSPSNRSAPHIRPKSEEGVHDSLSVPPSLIDNIIVEYLDSIIRMDSNFSPPPSEGVGIANMAHKYGFKVKA